MWILGRPGCSWPPGAVADRLLVLHTCAHLHQAGERGRRQPAADLVEPARQRRNGVRLFNVKNMFIHQSKIRVQV